MKHALLLTLCGTLTVNALDQNANQQSDIWEIQYGGINLLALGDTDGDGYTNAAESLAGTSPLDPLSKPALSMSSSPLDVMLHWPSQDGKRYDILGSTDLSQFSLLGSVMGDGLPKSQWLSNRGVSRQFFKLSMADVDSDSDGLTDWEEKVMGFNPRLNHTNRNDSNADLPRVLAALNAASTITLGLVDGDMREDWPDKGVIVIRRAGGLKPMWINLNITGTATRNTDYSTNITGTQIYMPFGAHEAWLELNPINDAIVEGNETITVNAIAGSGYTLGSPLRDPCLWKLRHLAGFDRPASRYGRVLDLALLGGTLTPQQFQIIRESVDRINPSSGIYNWHRERLGLLLNLFVTSAEFNVLR